MKCTIFKDNGLKKNINIIKFGPEIKLESDIFEQKIFIECSNDSIFGNNDCIRLEI